MKGKNIPKPILSFAEGNFPGKNVYIYIYIIAL